MDTIRRDVLPFTLLEFGAWLIVVALTVVVLPLTVVRTAARAVRPA